jgi:hypothetical protein
MKEITSELYMYLKREYISDKVKDEFSEKYHAEFAWAYYQKVKEVENAEMCVVTFTRDGQEHKKAIIKQQKVSDLNDNTMSDRFIDISGDKTSLTSSYVLNPNYDYKNDQITNIHIKTLNEVEFEGVFGKLNQEKLNEANQLMSGFCNLKEEGVIYSKEGEEFTYKIIENSDMTLGSLLLLDELRVYKNDIQIGYLKTKYTSDEIIQELLGKDYHIQMKDKISQDEKISYLEENDIKFDKNNYDIIFNLKINELKQTYKEIKRDLNIFNEIATIDYSNISDELKGRGIGSQMYLKIAEHYANKNMSFRSSSLQSPSAKGLWQKMKKDYPLQIEEVVIDNQNYYLLKSNTIENKAKSKRRNKKTL